MLGAIRVSPLVAAAPTVYVRTTRWRPVFHTCGPRCGRSRLERSGGAGGTEQWVVDALHGVPTRTGLGGDVANVALERRAGHRYRYRSRRGPRLGGPELGGARSRRSTVSSDERRHATFERRSGGQGPPPSAE